VIVNPARYRSKAAEAFTQEILPQFTNMPINLDRKALRSELAETAETSIPVDAPASESAPASNTGGKSLK
jgi:hypothetical protein